MWFYAERDKRDYITPEDIGDAIDDGIERTVLWGEVLEALGDKRVEDWSCCALVAWKFEPTTEM